MISRFFLSRPVFSTVISLVIILAGLVSLRALPIAQYPDIIPPEVLVATAYPGASPEIIAQTVAAPLEQQINGVENMLYMRSTSAGDGSVTIAVVFAVGTDPNQATINVNNRVQAAQPFLPDDVRRQGVTVTKKSSNMLMVLSMDSPEGRYDTIFVSNYALVNVIDELKRVPGVGDAMIFGAKDYSMRIWLRPDKLAQLKLTPADVAAAVREQNSQYAAGRIGEEPQPAPVDVNYMVITQGRLATAEEFENIILRADPDGSTLRLKDVARVELGSKDYSFVGKRMGHPTVPMGIFLASGANALDTADRVKAKMDELSKRFPEGVGYAIPYDTTTFVRVSIHEVVKTLAEAMLLVFLVVYLFLQSFRATLIPCLAVPVSIIGTFAGMYMLGFTINTLTLFGMVLAIGIVVDDAIVVLENVERIMRTQGLGPKEATAKAMEEVTGPVIAIVLVLCAVFVPVAFLGGLTGQMYKQFAITIAVSVVISGLVALTLTPSLCALLLKPVHEEPNRFFRGFNAWFDRITSGYSSGVAFLLRRAGVAVLLFAVLCAGAMALFRMTPSGMLPDEDQGYALAVNILPDGAALHHTLELSSQLDKMNLQDPVVRSNITFSGYDFLTGASRSNYSTSFLDLKPWDERTKPGESSFDLVGRIFGRGMALPRGLTLAFNPPPIQGMSSTGGFELYIQNRGEGDSKALAGMLDKVMAEGAKHPELGRLSTTFGANVPQLRVNLDRNKAKALGVPVNAVFEAMQATFGAYYINDFNKYGRTFRVMLQSEANFRDRPEGLRDVYVRSQRGEMIPLTALVDVQLTSGPEVVERFNVFPAAKIMGGPAPGFSSGQAIAAMEKAAAAALPPEYTLAWTGTAYQEKLTGGTSSLVFVLAIVMVFLILAAQYERWSLPVAVVLAVPFAMFGAILATWGRGLMNDLYFQIALVTLVGLAAKNAILIVEFATARQKKGMDAAQAALEASKLRFRPIIMTSLAFVLGCLPLAVSSGAGAASRHAIGTGVVGGMLGATVIAPFFIPVFYKIIVNLGARLRFKAGEASNGH
ncbi:efflux RND transporter permease subunit [Fundidesulfovibrio soli]|uniref:efflux RND transporter permease subunit n=1 Tax=Fundidesulfovibrio soli TaxID=2922716 RepID=UPI001FAEDD26|nr:multidrug efflux RND transporter permease subunit [Fundidesulfovibrio soli]